MILCVNYDLRAPGRNYQPLYDALARYTYCHMLESMWLLNTSENPATVRDALMKLIDQNDQIVVLRLKKHWAAARKCRCTEWLKDPSRTWE